MPLTITLRAAAVLAAALLLPPAAALAQSGTRELPASLGTATETSALPGGAWLALDKKALRLLDGQGREHDRLALRGKHLDSRSAGAGALAVVLDADTQRTLAVSVDLQHMRMRATPALESPAFSVQALCMYRDAQGHDHVFVVGDEGLAEQWLLRERGALQVRRLALPPQVQGCRVDDARQWLYVDEEGVGIWAYGAEAEAVPQRHAVALKQPLGPLRHAPRAMAVLAGGQAGGPGGTLATVDAAGQLRLWQEDAGRWRAGPEQRLAVRGRISALVAPTQADAALAWRDDGRAAWMVQRLPRAAAAATAPPAPLPYVLPRVQTEPMGRYGDAADDPAIWAHPKDPALSLVLGTNKRQGLLVYDLQGRQRQLLEVGRINNVDLRQRVQLGAHTLDLAVATQRDDLSVVLFLISEQGQVRELSRIATGLKDIYGVCLYQPATGGLEVLVNDKDGTFQRHSLGDAGTAADGSPRIGSQVVQRFKLASQPEACVADDAAARLFIGEEDRGVWAMSLQDTAAAPQLQLIAPVGGLLHADVEGLGLARGAAGSYLVVSSQGNNSYVVLDAAPPYRVRGAFRVGLDAQLGIDGVSETDGLEVTTTALGAHFPGGLLVLQDGFKRLPDGAQNFKLVRWDDVLRALALP